MKPRNAEVVTSYVPRDLARWLKDESRRRDISKSELVKQALRQMQETTCAKVASNPPETP